MIEELCVGARHSRLRRPCYTGIPEQGYGARFPLVIWVSQGITLQSTSTRRRPNCFNMVHQLKWMTHNKAGSAAENLKARPLRSYLFLKNGKAWESSTRFAEAYALGPGEASATLNLMNAVPAEIAERLTGFVRRL